MESEADEVHPAVCTAARCAGALAVELREFDVIIVLGGHSRAGGRR